MNHVTSHGTTIDRAQSKPEVQELSRLLYLVLVQTLKYRPLDIVKSVAKSNGFEAHILLVEDFEPKEQEQDVGPWRTASRGRAS